MRKEYLEALKYFKSTYNSFLKTTNDMFCQITISREQANEFVEEVEAVEKKLKALEIIKKKRVNVGKFIHITKILKRGYEDCKENNNSEFFNICNTRDFLTQEEFNLLKEILEC